MNFSVTVSGENPTSVSLVEELNNNIFISGKASFEAKKTDIKNISVTVGEKDNINVHSQDTIYVTGDVVRPSEIAPIQAAIGDLDSRTASNDSDIGALQTATGDLDSRVALNTSGVNTLTGNFSKIQLNLKYKEYQQTYFKDFIEVSGDLSKIEIYESPSKNTKFFTKNFFYNFFGDLTGVLITDHLDNKTLTKNYVYDISGNLVSVLENYS